MLTSTSSFSGGIAGYASIYHTCTQQLRSVPNSPLLRKGWALPTGAALLPQPSVGLRCEQPRGVCQPSLARRLLPYCFFPFPGRPPTRFGMNKCAFKQSIWFPHTHVRVTFRFTSTNISCRRRLMGAWTVLHEKRRYCGISIKEAVFCAWKAAKLYGMLLVSDAVKSWISQS